MVARALGLAFSCGVAAISAWVAVQASRLYVQEFEDVQESFRYFNQTYTALFGAVGLVVGFTLASLIYRQALELSRSLLGDLRRIPGRDKAAVVLGVFIGLGMTSLLGMTLVRIPHFGPPLVLLVGLVCTYLSVAIMLSMKEEMYYFFPATGPRQEPAEQTPRQQPKLLDTNVIIDGRIADVARAGFLEGPIYVPGFVLEELHLIADSPDTLRRNRGRRGLDILNEMQEEADVGVRIFEDYPRPAASSPQPAGGAGAEPAAERTRWLATEAVDAKLVQLAKELGAAIVTNDFNLNKVAQLQGVRVLNVNELANAVKPVVLPGEELAVTIVREGKEPDQGVAYLEDGTMVVVEHGKDRIGGSVRIVVTSVLQTVAGKMIFGTPQEGTAGAQEDSHHAHRRDGGPFTSGAGGGGPASQRPDHRADSLSGPRRKARPS